MLDTVRNKKNLNVRPSYIFVFIILSLITTIMHVDIIDLRYYDEQRALHEDILTHSAPAPYQYRILQPILVDSAVKIFTKFSENTKIEKYVFIGGYAAIRLIAILATLIAIFVTVNLFSSSISSMFAVVMVASFLPYTYRYYYYQPTSILEASFFAIAFLATAYRKFSILPILTLLGTLNRETAIFIPFAYFLYWLPNLQKSEWFSLFFSGGAWAAVFLGLRFLWPASVDLLDISYYIQQNITQVKGNIDVIVILSPLILLLFHRSSNSGLIRLYLCIFTWIILHFFVSQWWEIRYYVPVIIWAMPSIVEMLFRDEQTSSYC